jgi:hypothetical protein
MDSYNNNIYANIEAMSENSIDKNYIETLVELKEKIKTALSVNSEMICLYWEIGETIL